MRLILASASPRRAELLTAAGYAFEALPVDVDERAHLEEAPHTYVQRLASEKSAAALARVAKTSNADRIIVLGADTTVAIDGRILGKPLNDSEARGMLVRLSGRPHQVMTGLSLRTRTTESARVEETTVWFAALAPVDIEWYLATGEGQDKAGAYAIQGRASRFIPRIAGSYSNVVGLPVQAVEQLLRGLQAADSRLQEP